MSNLDGVSEYELKFQRKIDRILNENQALYGFYTFLSERSISTTHSYLMHVNDFLKYTNKPFNELNVDDFSGYMLKIQKKDNGEKCTSSYRITVYAALNKFGKYLTSRHYLNENPVKAYIDRPKAIDSPKTIEKRKNGYLTESEIKQYMTSVIDGAGTTLSIARQSEWRERDLAIITIFLNTGIRCSALVKLDTDNIDFGKKILSVVDKKSKYNIYELSDNTINVIKAWMVKRKLILCDSDPDVKALFISNRHTRISNTAVSSIVKKYACDIKGKNISPHKLRATYGTQLYNATKDIYFVQKCMKHNSPKTTELYVRGNDNQTKKASEIMGKIILNQT